MTYIPATPEDNKEMLAAIGLSNEKDLYADVPRELWLDSLAQSWEALDEMQLMQHMQTLAHANKVYDSIFMGAGAYHHFIPSAVDALASRSEFVTSYTPYQAEISQGVLQNIFEYQTMICELTGMDVSNASVYDGASAAAEACLMVRGRKREKILVSAAAHPQVLETISTYVLPAGMELEIIENTEGTTSLESLQKQMDDTVAGVYVASPNYYGQIEDVAAMADVAHDGGALLIVGVNPIAATLLKTPGELGADIAVGEGQPLGLPLAFGGPYLGFMACTQKLMRKLPGRIVGQTADDQGRRAFVLTLQAREQHIRRGKAASNICSNQAWCALRASIYMTLMGRQGLQDVAQHCYANAHYLQQQLQLLGFERVHTGEFFHEFVTTSPIPATKLQQKLAAHNILGGLPLPDNRILWCATEMNSKQDIDRLIEHVEEASHA